MTYPVLTDQVELGLSRNIQHLNKDNFNLLLKLFLTDLDNLEQTAFELVNQIDIDIATGYWLDLIGKIVGISRAGYNDVEYRKRIKTKIGVNTSDGTPNNIINIIKLATDSTSSILREYYPAYFISVINAADDVSGYVYDLINDIKPVGVGFELIQNNSGGEFVPAWEYPSQLLTNFNILLNDGSDPYSIILLDDGIIDDPATIEEYKILLDSGTDDNNTLLLDDGLDSTDILIAEDAFSDLEGILASGYELIYVTDTAFSKLHWEGDVDNYGILTQNIYSQTKN